MSKRRIIERCKTCNTQGFCVQRDCLWRNGVDSNINSDSSTAKHRVAGGENLIKYLSNSRVDEIVPGVAHHIELGNMCD
jgi:hypothetical protein